MHQFSDRGVDDGRNLLDRHVLKGLAQVAALDVLAVPIPPPLRLAIERFLMKCAGDAAIDAIGDVDCTDRLDRVVNKRRPRFFDFLPNKKPMPAGFGQRRGAAQRLDRSRLAQRDDDCIHGVMAVIGAVLLVLIAVGEYGIECPFVAKISGDSASAYLYPPASVAVNLAAV